MALLDVEAGFWGLRRQLEALVGARLADSVLQQAGANGGASFARSFEGAAGSAPVQALRDCVAAYQAAGFGQFEVEVTQWPIGRVLVRGGHTIEAWAIRQHDGHREQPCCAYSAGVLVGFVNVLTGRHDVVCIERTCQGRGDDACLFELLPAEAAHDVSAVAFDPDPALGRRLNLLEVLFDRMPMGIAVFDREYRLRRCNPTWADFVERHGPATATPARPGVHYSDLAPGAESVAFPLFERVLAGQTIQQDAVRLETDGGNVSYWDVVLAPIGGEGAVSGILNVTVDVTDRVQAQEELKRHRDKLDELVQVRTAELRRANQDLQEERDFITAVLETAGALVVVVDREGRIVRFNRGAEQTTGFSSREVVGERFWDIFLVQEELEAVKGVFNHLTAGRFPSEHQNYWLTKDGQRRLIAWSNTALLDSDGAVEYVVATGIDVTERERAKEQLRQARDKLEQRVEESTAELQRQVALEGLITRISTNFISSPSQEVDAGLNRALRDVGRFMDVDRSYVFLFSSDKKTMDNTHEWCAEAVEPQIRRMQDVPVDALPWANEVLMRGEVLHIPRVADLPPQARAERLEFQRQGIQFLIAVPMVYQGDTIGLLGFETVRAEKRWSENDVRLLEMLATVFVNALEHKRSQAIQAGQRQFLELLATGGNFSDTLQALVRIIEEQWPGMLGLVLVLDEDEHLHIGASVSLPEAYVESIEGLKIGPMVGSCGTACYRRERVIVEDIAEDPRWDGLRDVALRHGLHACWSEPVLSAEGDVIGTFAMYYRHPRAPTEAELRTIEIGAHLAGVAIERERADQALQESRRMLSTLISNLPGMAYRCRDDRDWTMEFVSAGSLELTGYRPEQLVGSEDLTYAGLVHPADRESVHEAVRAALDDRRHFEITYRILTPAGEKWVWERGQGVYTADGSVTALEGFVTDITERVTARRNLEQRVAERTRELATLLKISHDVASTLEVEPLLGLILDQLRTVVAYDAASIMILDDSDMSILAYRGPIPVQDALGLSLSVDEAGANRAVIERREPIIIDDVHGDEPLARAIRETAGAELDTTYGYIRAWMGVPLVVKDRVLGMVSLDHGEPGYYTAEDADLAMAFANQVAVAIDNARLYEAEQERLEESERRRQVAEGLRDILSILNSDRALEEVLDAIVEHALRLLGADGGAVYRLGREEERISIVTACGMPSEFMAIGDFPLAPTAVHRAVLQRGPFAVPDFSKMEPPADGSELPAAVQDLSMTVRNHFSASITVPLLVEGQLYGGVTLYHREPQEFSEEDIDLVLSFADQAALAIENARLRDEVEKAAVTAERSRLARDLHDAVTQTLFSSSLIADVLPRIWEVNPEEGRRRLEELRELTRGALAEMRTLLLELRPAALVDAQLRDLLHQLADSITGRARVPVSVQTEGAAELLSHGADQEGLPVGVKVALYRIAQEALNNVAKHAGATQATVRLQFHPDCVSLKIRDDGSGFDVESVPPESLGLGIMRERAEAIGATLSVESQVGRGTEIEVQWSAM